MVISAIKLWLIPSFSMMSNQFFDRLNYFTVSRAHHWFSATQCVTKRGLQCIWWNYAMFTYPVSWMKFASTGSHLPKIACSGIVSWTLRLLNYLVNHLTIPASVVRVCYSWLEYRQGSNFKCIFLTIQAIKKLSRKALNFTF